MRSVPLLPDALPLVGHSAHLFSDPAGFLRSASSRGGLVRFRIGPSEVILVCTPELVREVLLNDRIYDKGGPLFDRVRQVTGNGLLTCPHDTHRRQRRLLQPAFRKDRIPGYVEIMSRQVLDVVDSWHDGQVVDVRAAMQTITARSIIATMFAVELPPSLVDTVLEDVSVITASIYKRTLVPPALDGLPMLGKRPLDRARRRLFRTVSRVIFDYRASGRDQGDLLSILTTSRDDEPGGGKLSDTEISDQVLTFFLAGAEATGNVLTWALHLLAKHPDIQQRVHTEIGSVLSGPTATSAELALLPLTSNVVSEALRLYPPVWFITRRVSHDTVLGGCPLPAGTNVAFSPYSVHRLSAVYPDAAVFNPDRWSDPLSVPTPSGAYVPFSAGARKCIGDVLGVSEALLALTSVVARWRLHPVPGATVQFAKDIVLKPRELRLRVTRRG